ncbi:MAG: VWA domain-containing protein [Myxococcota bacterium]
MTEFDEQLTRWRLILGTASETSFGKGLTGAVQRADAALDWLYGRDAGGERSGPREAGQEDSQLTVPEWINEIHELFPKDTIERLERDAVEEYGLSEVVTDPRVLERAEPNEALLQAVLRTKHLMNEQVLASARKLVAKVVERLMKELAQEVRSRFQGNVVRDRSRRHPKGGPLDLRRTLLGNLSRYDRDTGKIYPEKTWFFERRHKKLDTWQIILLVDQSGSMLDSTIHASITAAILHGLPGVRSHLVVFDTNVVDLTDDAADPVKTLMTVQLGGGTDIANAVSYGASLVREGRRTILVLISDFYEGGSPGLLERRVKDLCEEGVKVLGLAALNRRGNPEFDRDLAGRLVRAGAEVGAMTPGELASWLAEKIRG